MAPFFGASREQVLKQLRARRAPKSEIYLGQGAPAALVAHIEGRWVLAVLVSDAPRRDRAYEEAMAQGDPWMPEHEWAYLIPGTVLHEAATHKELADLLEARDTWPW